MKKIIKIAVCAVIAIGLIFGISYGINRKEKSNTNDTDKSGDAQALKEELIKTAKENLIQQSEDQADAMEAYDYFYRNMLSDGKGNTTYPLNYAGAYLDGSKLVIQSTDGIELDGFKKFLSDYDCITYKKVDYSIVEMTSYAKEVKSQISSIIDYSILEQENKLKLYVKEENQVDTVKEEYDEYKHNFTPSHLKNLPVIIEASADVVHLD